MEQPELIDQILDTWRRHNEILLYLLEETPEEGWEAKPTGSRGRDVARQFAHLHRVRQGWLLFHQTGKRPKLPRFHQGEPPTKEYLSAVLGESGDGVEAFLETALTADARPRYFGNNVIRWMGYLIAHESHHRGQIMLALKQAGLRLPEEVAVGGLWKRWITGK